MFKIFHIALLQFVEMVDWPVSTVPGCKDMTITFCSGPMPNSICAFNNIIFNAALDAL